MKYKYWLTALCLVFSCQTKAYAVGGVSEKLYAAARSGDTATIESYLRSGNSIDALDNNGHTPLCNAYHDKNWNAYNILMQYGANSNAGCMTEKPKNTNKYIIAGVGTAIVIGGAAIAASSGGGGGGSSSSDSSSDKADDSSDTEETTDENIYTSGVEMTERQQAIASMTKDYIKVQSYTHKNSNNFKYMTEKDFRDPSGSKYKEFSGRGVSAETSTSKVVNFLDNVRAAKAFSYFYGTNANNEFANKLDTERNLVAVLDTGVEMRHSEFLRSDGKSKVSGQSFDYGPCRGLDNTNCWKIETYDPGLFKKTKQRRVLYDKDGKRVLEDNGYDYNEKTGEGELDEWAAEYSDTYDWDQLQDDPSPSVGKTAGNIDGHGTHVAGIIAANMDGKGMMGVAFSNTDIYGLRWDMISTIKDPIQAAINQNALALNISLGTAATASSNASKIDTTSLSYMQKETLAAARNTIRDYTTVKDPKSGYSQKQGMIWVMAAGNDSYSEPTILSGIKNLGLKPDGEGSTVNYNDLMMLVVMSVDVTMNNDGTVKTYKKSSFSNACGSTAAYCIAAPGGNKSEAISRIYSSVPTEAQSSGYGGLYGTSQAAPVVTGSIAFLKSAFPFLHSSEIIEILRETANTKGEGYSSSNHADKTYGAGLLDLGKAVTWYIPPQTSTGTMSMATLSGTTVNSPYINMSGAQIVLPSHMASAVQSALPQTMTVFDRYKRPFEVSMSRYISVTHSGHKGLQNDVSYIVPNTRIKHKTEGNIRLSYAQSAGKQSGEGYGFTDATYKTGKMSGGIFLSENTQYRMQGEDNQTLYNPYMSFTSAYGAHMGYALSPEYGFNLRAVSGRNGLYDGDKSFNDRTFKKRSYGVDGSLTFNPFKKIQMSITSGMLHEDEALLGMNGSGALGLSGSQTYFTGISAAYKATPKLTLSGSYYEGYTQAQRFNSNMLKTSSLISNGFAFDANYRYDKQTNIGIRITSPLRIEHGKLYVDMAHGRDYYSDAVYRNRYSAHLTPHKREYKLAFYGNREVTENVSISGEFDVRFNPDHQAASNDYRALFGLAWNF